MPPKVVGMNVDTLYLNVRTASDFPATLAEQLDALKLASQQADDDLPAPLLCQGVHPRVVMEILGHSQISLTMNTYSHVVPPLQEEATSKMDDLMSGKL
jgi:integrase